MLNLIIFGLVAALLVALKKIWDYRQAARTLHFAIQNHRPFLKTEASGSVGRDWDQLCADTNELIEEVARLQQLRSDQLAQLDATLGSLQEAVLIVDHENRILLGNKALQDIFPAATNILNQRLERVLHSSAFLAYVERVRANQAEPQQEIEFAESSRSVWTEVTGSVIPALNGQAGEWALFVLHDITKQKKLEIVRKDFVANVSHELRTPLSVIKGYVETLVDDHRDMPIDDRDRFLRTIQRHTERLNSLLEDLLTLSRLESINPGLRRESADVSSLIAAVVEDFRARPASAQHSLTFEADPALGVLLVDPLKISQVLENLCDNALKYTPPGSHIDVRARRRENDVEISVKDDGPGIPEADLPHIFERFYRVDKGRSREKGGTGLGLSIVKHIVQLHQGRVWAHSKVGQGTTFYFSLPVKNSNSAEK